MTKKPNASRRRVLASLIGGGLLSTHGDVLALSKHPPPQPTLEDHLRNADLIVVGVVREYVFKGTDVRNRAEFDIDFDSDSDSAQRRRQAEILVKKVLLGGDKKSFKNPIRIDYPTVQNGGKEWISGELIFVLKKMRTQLILGRGIEPVYYCLISPVNKNDLSVLSTLKNIQNHQTN